MGTLPIGSTLLAITERVMTMNKLIAVLALATALMGCDAATDMQMDKVHNKVADDMVARYDIAKKQGDAMQICVQAGMVSAAYLQAQDDAKYNEWKAIEKTDCKAAGIDK